MLTGRRREVLGGVKRHRHGSEGAGGAAVGGKGAAVRAAVATVRCAAR